MSDPRPGADVLRRLRAHGATRLERLCFRQNRSTIWSVTQGGRVMNLHVGYLDAPEAVIRSLAVIAREAGTASPAYRRAVRTARDWPGIHEALAAARRRPRRGRKPGSSRHARRCAGTPEQRAYLRAAYDALNDARFAGTLPRNLGLRFSSRMTTRLGQMLASGSGHDRRVHEIALNIDLMLRSNDHARIETLLHEMAHVAAFIQSGDRGHGPAWKRWAERAGCRPTRLAEPGVRRRRPGRQVTRVPPLPSPGARGLPSAALETPSWAAETPRSAELCPRDAGEPPTPRSAARDRPS